jgi:hypothetical protein
LVIDPEAAEIVKTIYQLASKGLGAIAISKSLERQMSCRQALISAFNEIPN